MRITIIAMLATGLLGLSTTLFAAGELPTRGMTQDAIRAKFGAPSRQVAPVGSPPISRWVYDDFTVYFEGKYSIHAVSHGKTLTTPPAGAATATTPAAVQGSVDELPPIEEIGEPATTPEAETAAPADPAPVENTFRFDPATGRIIEIGPDGKPVQSPTSQPGSSAPTPAQPQPAPASRNDSSDSKAVAPVAPPVSAPQSAPASAPAGTGTSMRFDPATGRMIEVGPDGTPVQPAEAAPTPAPAKQAPAEPAATAPAPAAEPEPTPAETAPTPAATPAPATTTEPARFRFDPATGRIVMDGAEQPGEPAEVQPAAEPVDEPAAVEEAKPASKPAPEQQPAEKSSEEKSQSDATAEDGGFSLQW